MNPRSSAKRSANIRVLLGLFVVLGLLFGPNTYQLIRLYWRERQLDHRLATLSAEQDRLVKEHQRLASDPTYVEGLIRSTFKVAQPGEIVIPLDDSSLHDD